MNCKYMDIFFKKAHLKKKHGTIISIIFIGMKFLVFWIFACLWASEYMNFKSLWPGIISCICFCWLFYLWFSCWTKKSMKISVSPPTPTQNKQTNTLSIRLIERSVMNHRRQTVKLHFNSVCCSILAGRASGGFTSAPVEDVGRRGVN